MVGKGALMVFLPPSASPWLLQFYAALRIGRNWLMPEGANLHVSLSIEKR
jgi:hypothetical protein